MPLEFLRQSTDGRITLVISPNARSVRTLWAVMDADNIADAREALRLREGTGSKKPEHIGSWAVEQEPPEPLSGLREWADARQIDGVVWTALPPKIGDTERTATSQEILDYLSGLTGAVREHAEQYVRRAPKQIDTSYRRLIEASLGWTAL